MFHKILRQWLAVAALAMLVFGVCTVYAQESCECGDAFDEWPPGGTGDDCGYASMCRSIVHFIIDASRCTGEPGTDSHKCTVTDGEVLENYGCTMTAVCPKSGPASIQGRVEIESVTRNNTPVPGAVVSAHADNGDTAETTTETDGSFTLRNLTNDLWFVQAVPPADDAAYMGYGKTKPLGVDLSDKDRVTLPDPLVLPRINNYRGKVLLPDGTPVPGAYIFAETENYDKSESAYSNSDGIFSLPLNHGLWIIHAEPPENDSYTEYGPSAPIVKEIPSDTTGVGTFILPRINTNHISGTVKYGPIPMPNITVTAYNWKSEDGYREVLTDIRGQFQMRVGSGAWNVRVLQKEGAEWLSPEHQEVIFDEGTSSEAVIDINLKAAATEGGRLVGKIVGPEGEELGNPGESVSIGADRTDGDLFFQSGGEDEIAEREIFPDDKGNFSFPLPEGIYEIWVWIDSEKYPNYAAPSSQMVKIKAGGVVDAGDIKLKKRGATVRGSLLDSQEKGIPGIAVEAWNPDSDEWFDTETDAFGNYRFKLSPEVWLITVFIPDRFVDLSQEIEVAETDISLDPFVLEDAAAKSGLITGSIQDENGIPLTDVEAVAYARVGDEIFPVSESWIIGGDFTLNVSDTEVYVGLYLPPGSSYTYSGEEALASPGETVTFQMMKNQTVIKGKLTDREGKPVTGVPGYVFATSGDFWQYGDINTQDGSYEIPAGTGLWMLSYEIESEKYMSYSPAPIPVEVKEGDTTVAQDITLNALEGIIRGQVQDPEGNPVPDIQVWVRSPSDKRTGKSVFETQVITDSEGRFKFFVPMDDPSAPTLRDTERGWGKPYSSGTTSQNCAWLTGTAQEDCYKSAAQQSTWPYKNKRSSDEREDEIILILRKADTSLKGKVFAEDGKTPVKDAYISAYSGDGQRAEGYTDANGDYSLQIARADTSEGNTWTLRAAYKPMGKNDYYRSANISHEISGTEPDVSIPNMTLTYMGALPPTETYEFQVATGWLRTLSDGTVINIPGYGVRTQKKTVKIVIEPRVKGLPDTVNDRSVVYGYAISLYEKDTRKEITEKFEKPATITFAYKDDILAKVGVQEANLRPAFFSETVQNWQPFNAFTADTSGNKITFRTDHFSVYALVEAMSEGEPGDIDGDNTITLKDIIAALQVCTNSMLSVSLKADVNGDGKIGLPEAMYIFRNLAETPTH